MYRDNSLFLVANNKKISSNKDNKNNKNKNQNDIPNFYSENTNIDTNLYQSNRVLSELLKQHYSLPDIVSHDDLTFDQDWNKRITDEEMIAEEVSE